MLLLALSNELPDLSTGTGDEGRDLRCSPYFMPMYITNRFQVKVVPYVVSLLLQEINNIFSYSAGGSKQFLFYFFPLLVFHDTPSCHQPVVYCLSKDAR
jgi:hypothetical protein